MYSLYEIYEKVFDEEASKYRWWYYHKLDKSRFNYSFNIYESVRQPFCKLSADRAFPGTV